MQNILKHILKNWKIPYWWLAKDALKSFDLSPFTRTQANQDKLTNHKFALAEVCPDFTQRADPAKPNKMFYTSKTFRDMGSH